MRLLPDQRKRDITELEVPPLAPQGHYVFTAYIADTSTIFDEDPFGFQVADSTGKPEYGGNELASSGYYLGTWKIINGWFGYNEGKEGAKNSSTSLALPKVFSISQNFPNPFNPSTSILFDVPEGQSSLAVSISIYDLRGRLVKELMNEKKAPGTYEIHWDGRDERDNKVSSGVYLYRIIAGDFSSTRKMVMLK